MKSAWESATEFIISLAASSTNELILYYLRKRGIIDEYSFQRTSRSDLSENWNEAVSKIRQAQEQEPSPPLPIAIRFDLKRNEYFTLQPGFLCLPWISSRKPMVDPQIPPELRWPCEWSRLETVPIYLIRKDIKQLKAKLSFDRMPTTKDGYTIRQCEINVFFRIDNFISFVDEFLKGMKFIFEEDEFINGYLKQGFTRAFENYVSQYTKRELKDEHYRTKLFEEYLETAIRSDAGLAKILTESGMKFEGVNYVDIEWDAEGATVLFEDACAQKSQRIRPTIFENLYGIEAADINVDDGIFWRSKLKGKISGKPVLDRTSKRIVIATREGHIYFLDYLGNVRKHMEAPGEDFEAGVVLWQGKAIVTSHSGKVWLISTTDGRSDVSEELNSDNLFFDFKKTIRTSPAIYEDDVYFSIVGGGVSGIYKLALNSSAPSAKLVWRSRVETTGRLKTAPLIVHDSFLLFTASKGWGRCSLDGNSSFFVSYPDGISRVAGRNVTYEPKTGTLFVGHTVLGLLAIDIDERRVKGKIGTNIPVRVSPTIYQQIAFVGNQRGQILAIDADGNNPNPSIWPLKVSTRPIKSQAAVWHDILFVADTGGTIFAIKIKEGIVWWRYRTGSAVYAPLLIDPTNGTVFASDENGNVTAIKWHYTKVADGIDMLKDWGKFEQAGHLAFLNGEYKRAKDLWEKADSSIGKKVISLCQRYGMEEDKTEDGDDAVF